MTIERNREENLRIAARHGARNVRVFGSVERGEDRGAITSPSVSYLPRPAIRSAVVPKYTAPAAKPIPK
jgi:hypothetical protein